MAIVLEDVAEDIRDFFYENGNSDLQVELTEEGINIYLDLPSVNNYDYHFSELERFFINNGNYDAEDFTLDGDYEGVITAFYEA